jgi:hypothetical protein
MESILCEANIRSRQTRVTPQKGSNFCSDRCIVFKFLQEFLEAVFLVEAMESLLGEEEVSSCHTTVRLQKHLNF